MPTPPSSPAPAAPERIVLFDGVCKLCNAWARFLIRFDSRRVFRLCTVQSPQGQALLARHGLPADHYETMVVLHGARAYTRSVAFIHGVAALGWPWKLATLAWLLPRPLRDWLYDRIALNRYRLFGRYEQCVLAMPVHPERFPDA